MVTEAVGRLEIIPLWNCGGLTALQNREISNKSQYLSWLLCVYFFPLSFSEISLELRKFLSAGGGGGTHNVPSSGLSLKLLQEATKIMNLD